MKYSVSFFAAFAMSFGLLSSAGAQTRGVGAGALMLDDNLGHSITVETPQNPSAEWTAWQAAGFPNLWIFPVPPSNGAQSGFVYSGPLTGEALPALLSYWLPPNTTTINGGTYTGGAAGAWDFAGTGQLGLVTGTGTLNALAKWGTDSSLTGSSITDNGTTVSTTEIFAGNGGQLTHVNADSINHMLVPSNTGTGYLANDGSGNLSWTASAFASKAGIGNWAASSVGTNKTNQVVDVAGSTVSTIIPVFAGSITGLSAVMSAACTGGTLVATVYINGTAQFSTTISTSNPVHNFATASAGTYPFNAGDLITVEYTTSSYSTGNSDFLGTVFVTF